MIEITEKKLCSGCTACANICPKECIKMVADEEGFLYPVANFSLCIECGACEKVCPFKNPVKEICTPQKGYLVQHKDESVRQDSTSGGAFTAIAESILKKEGVVFGAAYDENFQVNHRYVENRRELKIFRNSKYVQSNLGDCFKQVKCFLDANRWVCFSGTPCQIEGLSKFLKKPYERLVLVDVVCHGIPSPLIWNKYLEYQNIGEEKPDNIRFRDKLYGYKYSTLSIIQDGKNVYHAGAQKDPMLRAFFSDICDRPSCYDCPFKKRYRVSDMTIWDCFSVYNFDKEMDDDKGTTRVLCHTSKGVSIIKAMETGKCKEVPADMLIYGVKEMLESVSMNPGRDRFFADAQIMNGKELFSKYYPMSIKVHIITLFRRFLVTMGVYKTIKRYLNIIRGR